MLVDNFLKTTVMGLPVVNTGDINKASEKE